MRLKSSGITDMHTHTHTHTHTPTHAHTDTYTHTHTHAHTHTDTNTLKQRDQPHRWVTAESRDLSGVSHCNLLSSAH